MINHCTNDGRNIGELCAYCFDRVDHDEPPKRKAGSSSGSNHNDPGFDNVIRAMEEDR
jgi:hypothetical protein